MQVCDRCRKPNSGGTPTQIFNVELSIDFATRIVDGWDLCSTCATKVREVVSLTVVGECIEPPAVGTQFLATEAARKGFYEGDR